MSEKVDILTHAETRTPEDEFIQSEVIYRIGNQHYSAQTSEIRSGCIDESNVESLQRVPIPHEHIFPLCSAAKLSIVRQEDMSSCYIKKAQLIGYDSNDPGKIPARVLAEAKVLEVLSINPHPNIVKYWGCTTENGFYTGICLERCVESLRERVELERLKQPDVDDEAVIASLESGLRHLHGLGYCHNDINPANIMFREDDSIAIIDFDSCQRTKDLLGSKKGTHAFYDSSATHSEESNDWYGVEKVREYLAERTEINKKKRGKERGKEQGTKKVAV